MTTGDQSQGAASVAVESSAYDRWMHSVGIPVHTGYFIQDLRTLELGWWDERQCDAAFIQLSGQEGVSENRVTEIKPATTLPPVQLGMDEAVYVLGGRGLTTIWSVDGTREWTFEWNKHSMFLLPRHHRFQLSNAHGQESARLLHYNYLPLICSLGPDPELCLHPEPAAYQDLDREDLFSTATEDSKVGPPGRRNVWRGNFFPDLLAWDKLISGRAGQQTVTMHFDSPIRTHMSVFPVGAYWEAHRHGPGVAIVIPSGEGYAVMWQEGGEKLVVPWQEGSLYVPPDRWFHQHFNVAASQTRYLAFHLPIAMSTGWRQLRDDRVAYADEDAWIREKYQEELGKRGIAFNMPEGLFTDPDFAWAGGA
ncbi:MAG: cupin domain-containing protein [Chloroflexi bacterium]|nr:cupin domain-containing protein [Chloroflexota bacterium]MCH7655148.1 cupin domain-containing protein [Chloroflexota bacterium]